MSTDSINSIICIYKFKVTIFKTVFLTIILPHFPDAITIIFLNIYNISPYSSCMPYAGVFFYSQMICDLKGYIYYYIT